MMKLPTFALDVRLAGGNNTGDSTYWTGLLLGLAKLKPDARFLLYSNTERPKIIPESELFHWITIPAKSSRWWSLVNFPLDARKRGAVGIHTQYSLSPLVGSRGFTTIHDVSFFIGPEWFSTRDGLILRSTVPRAAKRAKAIFAVSHTGKGEIEKFLPGVGSKTLVTPNACPPWIQSQKPEQAKAEIERSLKIDRPFILTVGTRWPRKNMELAVQAMDGLAGRFPHRLVITGKSGWGDDSLGSRSVPTGYVSNHQLSNLYSTATLYLAPSRHEGFGIPILEAFRCGCPVLSSTGGALPEVVGDAGVIEPSWEPEVWTNTIENLLSDSSKLKNLRERGILRETQFTWEQMAKKTMNGYLGDLDDR